jgi:hypothetical protein
LTVDVLEPPLELPLHLKGFLIIGWVNAKDSIVLQVMEEARGSVGRDFWVLFLYKVLIST